MTRTGDGKLRTGKFETMLEYINLSAGPTDRRRPDLSRPSSLSAIKYRRRESRRWTLLAGTTQKNGSVFGNDEELYKFTLRRDIIIWSQFFSSTFGRTQMLQPNVLARRLRYHKARRQVRTTPDIVRSNIIIIYTDEKLPKTDRAPAGQSGRARTNEDDESNES